MTSGRATLLARLGAVLAALAASFAPRTAAADLGEDIARLEQAWSRFGKTERLAPRLVERGDQQFVFVPPELLHGGSADCISVAVLGASSIHFAVRAAGTGLLPGPEPSFPEPSVAGLVQLTRCGARKARLGVLLIEPRSPRAVLETVVVRSRQPIPAALEVLPRRDPGPVAPLSVATPRPVPQPLAERVLVARARAERHGALDLAEQNVTSSPRGTGTLSRVVGMGCHRLELMAEPRGSDASYELAAIAEFEGAASVASTERGDGLDVTITLCAAGETPVLVHFGGAPASAPLRLVSSSQPLPPGLPRDWDGLSRAHMAALLLRHGARPNGSPVDQSLGVQGPTAMPVELEPGSCYLAALAGLRVPPSPLALAADLGAETVQSRAPPESGGTVLSFCVRRDPTVLFEVSSSSSGSVWRFALWRTGSIALGERGPL